MLSVEYRNAVDSILNKIVEKRKELNALDAELHTLIEKKHEREEVSSLSLETRV